MRRSVLVVALFVAGCNFGSPLPPANPDVDAGVDAPGRPPDADPQAWLNGWSRRKSITLHASQIAAPGNGALADFPVLISIADADIRARALGTGADIVFTDGDATTMLASEIEAFTPGANDQLVAWVKVPMLSATTDTTIYVYYGNPTPPPRTPEEVWTANYLAVWHLHQDPGPGNNGDIRDATSGNRDGTASSAMQSSDRVRGRIGLGLRFNGDDAYLDFTTMDFGNNFTISMWVNFDGGTSVKTLMSNSGPGPDTDGFRLFVNSFSTENRRIIFETGNGNAPGGSNIAETGDNAIPTETFTHVAAVVNRTAGTAQIFVNGASVATDPSIRNDFMTSSDFEIARMEVNNNINFPGILDEVRVSSTLRSPEWLRTSYNNQAQPGTFHAVGPEEVRR